MADIEKTNFFTEQLLEAIDLIAEKKISNLSFDKTILCTVMEVIDEKAGKYLVSFNSDSFKTSSFFAYAQTGAIYEDGDTVYVNVP